MKAHIFHFHVIGWKFQPILTSPISHYFETLDNFYDHISVVRNSWGAI